MHHIIFIQQEVHIFGYLVTEHGMGEFGMIYSGIVGQDAVNFLLLIKSGEVINAFNKEGIGDIDLIYGEPGIHGCGLAHIAEIHAKDLDKISFIINAGSVVVQASDRKLIIYQSQDKKYIAAVKLDWNGKKKKWLVTAYGNNIS